MRKYCRNIINYIKAHTVLFAAVLIVFIVLINSFVFTPCTAVGASMFPTIRSGQMCVANRISKSYKRGDIVYCRDPEGDQNLIKRIIGLPGEMIEIKDGKIYVNGEEIKDYTDSKDLESCLKIELSDQEYFLMGDNRSHSRDSRAFGPVLSKQIIGKVTILPF